MSQQIKSKESSKAGLGSFPAKSTSEEKVFEGYSTDQIIDIIAKTQNVTREGAKSLFETFPREKIEAILLQSKEKVPISIPVEPSAKSVKIEKPKAQATPTKVVTPSGKAIPTSEKPIKDPVAEDMSIVPSPSADLVPESVFLTPIMTIEQIAANYNFMQQVVKTLLKEGVHYGIPVRDGKPIWDKPGLYKAGANFLGRIFGLRPEYEELVSVEDHEKSNFRYKVRCTLIRIKTGASVSSGIGAASSQESRFNRENKPYLKPDLWHTILSMAYKRSLVAAMKYATGADEFFVGEEETE